MTRPDPRIEAAVRAWFGMLMPKTASAEEVDAMWATSPGDAFLSLYESVGIILAASDAADPLRQPDARHRCYALEEASNVARSEWWAEVEKEIEARGTASS